MSVRQSKGFTLIELVIVIIVLGILAATAIPRFLNLSSDADVAVVQGGATALQGGVNLAHTKWLALGSPNDFDSRDNVQLYGNSAEGTIDINKSGWPAQSYALTDTVISTDNADDCLSLWNALVDLGSQEVQLDDSGFYKVVYDSTAKICRYELVSDTSIYITYNPNTGIVTAVTP